MIRSCVWHFRGGLCLFVNVRCFLVNTNEFPQYAGSGNEMFLFFLTVDMNNG